MTSYEMLWDCTSCGTKKLLGKSHRRCPHCGAPQDPSTRYFPPPGEEVEAAGHVYVGADWRCAACETPNSRAADFCVNCGNHRDGNADVKRVVDAPAPAPVVATTAPSKRRWPVLLGAAVVGLVVFALVAAFWKRDVQVRVESHSWSRSIDVERLDPRHESAWCDSMPGDAYSVSRSREVRSHRQIPDGETCTTSRVDDGDGTFHTEKKCSTKYRSEPVYSDKCHYTVDRWGVARTLRSGGGLQQARVWPTVSLGRTGSCRGCEREGPRREVLTVALRDSREAQKTWSCDVDEARWKQLRDGEVRPMKVRVIGGGADCGSLR
jgi:hypothetical protein